MGQGISPKNTKNFVINRSMGQAIHGSRYMGVARSTFLADKKGKIFKVFPKVKPAGHSKEVLECFKDI